MVQYMSKLILSCVRSMKLCLNTCPTCPIQDNWHFLDSLMNFISLYRRIEKLLDIFIQLPKYIHQVSFH